LRGGEKRGAKAAALTEQTGLQLAIPDHVEGEG
jgi:hypothetical protein